MSLTGNLATMPLPELLQWLGQHGKTGSLQVDHGKLRRTSWIAKGWIAGFTSHDPSHLLGQFLLSRGRINEQTLQNALTIHSSTGVDIGKILVEMKAVDEATLKRIAVARAEEAMLTMFEWPDGQFIFDPEASPDLDLVEVNLKHDDLIARGIKRRDATQQMKRLFVNHDIVLCRTDRPLGEKTSKSAVAKRIYGLIDGRKTLGEVLLVSRASEFLVTQFLYELCHKGIIQVQKIQDPEAETETAEVCCALAEDFVSRGEYEAAIDILRHNQTIDPGNTLMELTLKKIEGDYLEYLYAELVPADKIVSALRDRESIETSKELRTTELYLLAMIAGNRWSVDALVRLTPIREVEVMRALKHLLSMHIVELVDPPSDNDETTAQEETLLQIDQALTDLNENLTDTTQ